MSYRHPHTRLFRPTDAAHMKFIDPPDTSAIANLASIPFSVSPRMRSATDDALTRLLCSIAAMHFALVAHPDLDHNGLRGPPTIS